MSVELVGIAGQTRDAFARVFPAALAARAKVLDDSITAANCSVAADAAAFVVVVSAARAARFPKAARIAAAATLGGLPDQPGTAPLVAIAQVLKQCGVNARDLRLAEVMEAYAVQAIACVRGAGLDPASVNCGGGALARGHPIGASGAVLAVRLFHSLPAGLGLATIAAAGGIGTAVILER